MGSPCLCCLLCWSYSLYSFKSLALHMVSHSLGKMYITCTHAYIYNNMMTLQCTREYHLLVCVAGDSRPCRKGGGGGVGANDKGITSIILKLMRITTKRYF